MKSAFLLVILLIISSCGSLPRTDVKVIKMKDARKASFAKTSPKNIEIYESQYPDGVVKNGDLIAVSPSHKSRIKILGKVTVKLQKGKFASPLIFTKSKSAPFFKDEDKTGMHSYCKNMAWQAGIGWITFFTLNYIAPWNWPCYATDSYSSADPEDVTYREEAIKEKMRARASELGGNAIIGLNYGGESLVNVGTGRVLSTSPVWSGVAFIVHIK